MKTIKPLRALFLFLAFTLPITRTKSQVVSDSLTIKLQQAFKKESLPGMYVIMSDGNKIIYSQSFGYADVANKTPYSASNIQNIGSVSKTLIAVALMKAVELKYFYIRD